MFSTLIPAILFWILLPIHTLTVTDLSTGGVIIRHPVAPGDTFKSVYIHSLELTPVWEYFQIDARYDIILTDTLYESAGAGLPIPIDGQDTFRKEGRQFHIFNIQRHLPAIVLRVSSAYDNRIMLNDALAFNLSDMLGNAVVRIETRTEPRGIFTFRALLRDLVHHFGDL